MTTSNIKAVLRHDIDHIWKTVSAFERYHTWRKNVSKTEKIDEKQFIEYTKEGYSTTFRITASEPNKSLSLDMENNHVKGHWTIAFMPKGDETEIDFTACAEAKKLVTRPVGKSVFEQRYLEQEQTQFIADLKESLG